MISQALSRGEKKQLSVQIFTFLRFCATLNKIQQVDPEAFLHCLISKKDYLSKLSSGETFHSISSRKPVRFNRFNNGEIQQKFQWINLILLSV